MEFDLEITGNRLEKGDSSALETFVFPKSYVDFVEKYGYGLSCNLFLIYIPMGDYPDSFFVRKDEIISTYQDVLDDEDEIWFDLEPDITYEQLKQMVPFGISENGHYLFWDTGESSENGEFNIYITDFRGVGFTKVASNLYEFFERVTSKEEFETVLPFTQEALSKTFKPLEKRLP